MYLIITRCWCREKFEYICWEREKIGWIKKSWKRKNLIQSKTIVIYTRLQVLLGLNKSGHSKFLTETSGLIDKLYEKGEIQNENQYRNAPDNVHIKKTELPGYFLEQTVQDLK